MKRILIGEASSYKAIVIAKYIAEHYPGTEIHTYDFKSVFIKYHSRYFKKIIPLPDPFLQEQNFLNTLSEYIHQNQINYFFPVNSNHIKLLLENRSTFNNTLDYYGVVDTYETLNNKHKLQTLAAKLKITIPKNFTNTTKIKFPLVVKPNEGSSSKGVYYFHNREEFEKQNRETPFTDHVFQQFISGTGAGYSVFARNGKILKGFGHARLAEYPVSGGSSVFRATIDNPEMMEVAQKIISETQWSGFAMIEFKIKQNGEPVLIEVNPRIWGSINQGLQCGCNYFEPLLGISEIKSKHNNKTKTYLSPLIYFSLFKYVLKGRVNKFFHFIFARHKVADVSLFDDFNGFISMLIRKLF